MDEATFVLAKFVQVSSDFDNVPAKLSDSFRFIGFDGVNEIIVELAINRRPTRALLTPKRLIA